MSHKYKVLTCSQDSRYPQDLVLTLRFNGEAPDAEQIICLVEDAPDLLEALESAAGWLEWLDDPRSGLGDDHKKVIKQARTAIAKARGES